MSSEKEEQENIEVKIIDRETALWQDILKECEKELESIEYNSFRSMTFQKAIRELAISKIAELEKRDE